jgi:general secretion pathway protein D
LKDLVTWVSATLCKPVIVPTNLRQQKVQIYAPSLITQPEAYRMFLASLNSMGITIQPEGNSLLLIESNRARESPVPFMGPDRNAPDNASYVTKVMRVDNASVEDINGVLGKLKSKDGDIVVYAPTRTLIITDVAENIRRMDEIVKMLDQPFAGEKIWVKKLRNTPAQEMAQLLEKIFQPKGGGGGGGGGARGRTQAGAAPVEGATGGEGTASLIIPEERANMLIIVANERTWLQMLAVIDRVEQASSSPLEASADRVHVYPLANANAEDMASTLSGLGVGVSVGGKGRTGTSTPGGPASSSSASHAPAAGGTSSAAQNVGLFEGDVRVAADKPTNSLVIVASGKDYYTLRDIIRKLDITRRQVFIEATILEVSLDKARKLGAAFHAGGTVFSGSNQSLLFGGSEPNASTNSILFNPAALSGLAAGLRGPAIPGADTILGLPPGTSVPAFGVFLQALQNNNDVNVVSLPHILTSDNEKANIEVGQNLPFPGMFGGGFGLPLGGGLPGAGTSPTGGTTGGFGLPGFGTSVQRQDVSLKLEITPHVNDSDYVRLEIDNEISDVASDNYNGLGPATNKRKVKTVVVVRDQQPVVLGGLIKDRSAESVDKVPLLGDIPIIGYLFKYTRKTLTKQNLLIIITPYVIKDPADLRRIFERKVAERREFLERFSSFHDDDNFDAHIDYRHKRGLLEEINRTAIEAEREAADLRNAEAIARGRVIEGPVEPRSPSTAPKVETPPAPYPYRPAEPIPPGPVFRPIPPAPSEVAPERGERE